MKVTQIKMSMSLEQSLEILAHTLYDHYCQAVGGKAFNGDPLPLSGEFFADESKEKQANAWRETARKAYDLQNTFEKRTPFVIPPIHEGKGSFGEAIELAKRGFKVARTGWNGSGMFAYIVPAASYPAKTGAAKQYFGQDALVPYREYWALKTAQNDIATWSPSGSDSLANDWCIVD